MADRWNSGSDAAYIKPKFVPDYELHGRDDSGGPEWVPYTQQFGDGGYVTGDKAHLSARGGMTDQEEGGLVSDEPRVKAALRAEGMGRQSPSRPSTKEARET